MNIVKFENFPEDEREAFYRLCKAMGQDPSCFDISAKEKLAEGLVPRQRIVVVIDSRDGWRFENNRGFIQVDWVDAFQRAFTARMGN